jgi:hypothetical protein
MQHVVAKTCEGNLYKKNLEVLKQMSLRLAYVMVKDSLLVENLGIVYCRHPLSCIREVAQRKGKQDNIWEDFYSTHSNKYEPTRGKFLSTTMVIWQRIVNKSTLRGLCDIEVG